VRNLNAIRSFSHGCYVLIQPHSSLVGKCGALFTPIHRSSMPCESTVQLVEKLTIYLIHGEGDLWNIPRFGVSIGLCALLAWISQNRTCRPGSHCVHRWPWFQGFTLNTWSYGVLLADWQGRKLFRGLGTCWSDITFSLACRVLYTLATNVWRNYPDSPVFPGIHEVWVLLKGTLLRWKPRNSLMPEYLIFMGHSQTVGVFVCVWAHGWL
jgi:hypothetical protein